MYGKIIARDVKTNKDSDINTTLYIEVYDNNHTKYTTNLIQDSLYWYRNKNHNNIDSGLIKEINATKTSKLKDIEFDISNIDTPNNGNIVITIPNHSGKFRLHIKTNSWLWYVPANFGYDYNETKNSNCLEHPCFNYTKTTNPTEHISSGTYGGGTIDVEDRGNYIKHGLKVFR